VPRRLTRFCLWLRLITDNNYLKTNPMIYKILALIAVLSVLAGCDVDRNDPKYDQLRYDQMQKANCVEIASVLSAKAIMDKPEDYDAALKRCQDNKIMTFDEYKVFADHGRETGVWDVYVVFPDKF